MMGAAMARTATFRRWIKLDLSGPVAPNGSEYLLKLARLGSRADNASVAIAKSNQRGA
jgi:hypothetical protein